jgi:hypothetical protein
MTTEAGLTIIVAIVAALAAIAAAVFTGVQAAAARQSVKDSRAAQIASEGARDESTRLAAEANNLAARQAAALEQQVQAEASKNAPSVEWQISAGPGRDTQVITNMGRKTAYNVSLIGGAGIHTDEDSEREELSTGDSVEFAVWQGSGMSTPRLTILWQEEPDGEQRTKTVSVRSRR